MAPRARRFKRTFVTVSTKPNPGTTRGGELYECPNSCVACSRASCCRRRPFYEEEAEQ